MGQILCKVKASEKRGGIKLRIPSVSSEAALHIMGDACLYEDPCYPSLQELYEASRGSKKARKIVRQVLAVRVGQGPETDPLWSKPLDASVMESLRERQAPDLDDLVKLRDSWEGQRFNDMCHKLKRDKC